MKLSLAVISFIALIVTSSCQMLEEARMKTPVPTRKVDLQAEMRRIILKARSLAADPDYIAYTRQLDIVKHFKEELPKIIPGAEKTHIENAKEWAAFLVSEVELIKDAFAAQCGEKKDSVYREFAEITRGPIFIELSQDDQDRVMEKAFKIILHKYECNKL